VEATINSPGVASQRWSSRDSLSWIDPSEVFTDTQRVDLWNDPRWETTVRVAPKRAGSDDERRSWRSTLAVATRLGRVLKKRGRHSRHLV
jgi:hypothetical protein